MRGGSDVGCFRRAPRVVVCARLQLPIADAAEIVEDVFLGMPALVTNDEVEARLQRIKGEGDAKRRLPSLRRKADVVCGW